MDILIPATTHIVTWVKQNVLDTATYYVKAVIRDKRTDAILETLTLTDLGSSARFSATWNVPQDPSGQGREISVVKTVYEDAAYTQVSAAYGSWEDDYLIYDLKQPGGTGGGAGGAGRVDYAAIRTIVEKSVEAAIKNLPPPKDIDLSEITGELDDVKETLRDRIKALLSLGKKADSWAEAEKRMTSFIAEFAKIAEDAKKAILAETKNAKEAIKAAAEDAKHSMADSSKKNVDEISSASKTSVELMAHAVSDYVDRMKKATDALVEQCAETMAETLAKPLYLKVVNNMELVRENEKDFKKDDKTGKRTEVIKKMLYKP